PRRHIDHFQNWRRRAVRQVPHVRIPLHVVGGVDLAALNVVDKLRVEDRAASPVVEVVKALRDKFEYRWPFLGLIQDIDAFPLHLAMKHEAVLENDEVRLSAGKQARGDAKKPDKKADADDSDG